MNESNDIELICGLKSYSIRLTSHQMVKLLYYYVLLNSMLMNESSNIKLSCGLKSYSIRLI